MSGQGMAVSRFLQNDCRGSELPHTLLRMSQKSASLFRFAPVIRDLTLAIALEPVSVFIH